MIKIKTNIKKYMLKLTVGKAVPKVNLIVLKYIYLEIIKT